MNNDVKIIAHRGASGYAPENTAAAFDQAIEQGVNGIECDVQQCASGELIVIHDKRLERTTNLIGFVKDRTFEELRQADIGSWYNEKYKNERILTLSEFIEKYANKTVLFIELKSEGSAQRAAVVVSNRDKAENVIFISFLHQEIEKVKHINSAIKTGLIVRGVETPENIINMAAASKADIISVHHPLCSEELIRLCHSHDIPIGVWTVDDPNQALLLTQMGIHYITTNFPDKILNALKDNAG